MGTGHRRGHVIIIVQGGGGLVVAVIHLDVESARVIETWVGSHGVVGAETGLATAHDHVQPDRCDVADQADNVECEEGFVAPAHGDAGRIAPVGGCAGGCYGACQAPAQEAQG